MSWGDVFSKLYGWTINRALTEPVRPRTACSEVLAEMEASEPELVPDHDAAQLAI